MVKYLSCRACMRDLDLEGERGGLGVAAYWFCGKLVPWSTCVCTSYYKIEYGLAHALLIFPRLALLGKRGFLV